MRVLTQNEVSTVAGGALVVGKNLNLSLVTGSQTSVLSRLVGGAGVSLSTDKVLSLGRSSSSCGCGSSE